MCNYESISIRCVKSQIFCMSEQYNLKNWSVWRRMVKVLLFFHSLFSLLSHHFILFFSPLSFFLIHSSSYIPINLSSFLLSLFFLLTLVAFLSSSQPRHTTSSTWCRSLLLWFFFFGSDLMGGFGSGWVQMVMGKLMVVGCDWWIQWWVGHLVSLSMGCDGDGQIGGGGFWCANSMVGGPACGWVPMDGSMVGGMWGIDGC